MKKLAFATLLSVLISNVAESKISLTVEKVRDLAMEHNRQLQSARKEIDRARGDIISARSGALPQVSLDGRLTRNLKEQVIFLPDFSDESDELVKVPISQNNDISLALSVTQPIYNGGRAFTAWHIAKIYEDYSHEKVKEVEREILFSAEAIFYAAVLAEENLKVIQSAFDQLQYNLDVVTQFHDQGMSSHYELLRARVEKSNLEPQLAAAESNVSFSRKQLKSFLGLSLDEDIDLKGDLSDTLLIDLPSLESLSQKALENRPEIKQAQLQTKGYDKAVSIARSTWLRPQLNLNTTYTFAASSNDFKLYDNETSKSWTASVLLTVPLFDGGRTIGEVRKAKTDYYQSVLNEKQMYDDIHLEVEQSYDKLIQAKKALNSQRETIQQAEEGMRIANLRYETGVGTQLEILSAQTALTDARTNLARAIYDFRLAKAKLKKSSGIDIK